MLRKNYFLSDPSAKEIDPWVAAGDLREKEMEKRFLPTQFLIFYTSSAMKNTKTSKSTVVTWEHSESPQEKELE